LLAAQAAHPLVNAVAVDDDLFDRQYPWAAAVVDPDSGGICGGTVIHPRWVLTAAHCTSGGRYVLIGDAERSAARRVAVTRAIRHPQYSIDSMQNDVGLLYLAESVDVRPAALATDISGRLLLRSRVAATIIGWGKTESSAKPVDRLRAARIYLEDYARAGTRYVYRYTAGPCARDSGSPMLMRTLDGRWLVVGIATATDGNLCATGGGRAVYTSLYAVRDFIFEHVGSD
jgi:secreted trypsin-like serine protease